MGRLWAAAAAVAAVSLIALSLLLISLDQSPLPLRIYYVPSRSMEPTLSVGDLVVAVAASPREVSCGPQGDIIVYRRPDGARIIHRAVACVEREGRLYFLTKGDNNPYYDQDPGNPYTWVPEDRVVAKYVLRIPLLGYVPMALEWARPLLLPIILAAIAYIIYSSLSSPRGGRGRAPGARRPRRP